MKRDAGTKYRVGLAVAALAPAIAFGCGTLTADSGLSPDPDAATDAPITTDALQPFDAGNVDAAPTVYCIDAGVHDLCADFEGAADWSGQFVGPSSSPPPALVADPLAPSATHALESQIEYFESDAGFHAAGLQKIENYPNAKEIPRVRIELDLDVVRVEPAPGHGCFLFQIGAPFFALQALELLGGTGNLTFTVSTGDPANPNTQTVSGTAVRGTWFHVLVELPDRTPSNIATGAITIAGAPSTFTLPPYADPIDRFIATVGLHSGSGGGGWTARYDNVLLDWR